MSISVSFEDIYNNINCCITPPETTIDGIVGPCPIYAGKLVPGLIPAIKFFMSYPHVSWNATTITIGNKKYGKLDYKGQMRELKKDIKNYLEKNNYNGLYIFELQKNGNIHCHGIDDGYRSKFEEAFSKYGKRNSNNESHKLVKHLEDYLRYICKNEDQLIHNLVYKIHAGNVNLKSQ